MRRSGCVSEAPFDSESERYRRSVVIVVPTLELGGAERQAILLARMLRERGVRPTVGAWFPRGRGRELCERWAVPWIGLPNPFPTPADWWSRRRALFAFGRALRVLKPTCLLSYLNDANTACGLVRRVVGCKKWIWNQRSMPDGRDELSGTGQNALRRCKHVTANSEAVLRALSGRYLVKPERISVIRNGVALDRPAMTRIEWRERLGATSAGLVAVMIANLTGYKDHVSLIRAWHKFVVGAKAGADKAVLALAGYCGETAAELKTLSIDLGVSASVRFLGQVEDVAGLLAAADVAIYSSRCEGSPNGVLEAMAASLPVIVTDIEATREILGGGQEDVFFGVGRIEDLAGLIHRAASDTEWRRERGEWNRRRISDRYTVERMMDGYWRVIGGN